MQAAIDLILAAMFLILSYRAYCEGTLELFPILQTGFLFFILIELHRIRRGQD